MAALLERGSAGHRTGGILGLCLFLTEHGEAVEFDLLSTGRSLADLGTLALSWRELAVLVRGWQSRPGTATQESVHGVVWRVEGQLLADVLDTLRSANWQRAGKKSAPKPKRVPRPWEQQAKKQTIGADPIPISQFSDWWDSKARSA